MITTPEYRREVTARALRLAEEWNAWPFTLSGPAIEPIRRRLGGTSLLMMMMDLALDLQTAARDVERLAGLACNESVCGLPEPAEVEWHLLGEMISRAGKTLRRIRTAYGVVPSRWHRPDNKLRPRPKVMRTAPPNGPTMAQGQLEQLPRVTDT